MKLTVALVIEGFFNVPLHAAQELGLFAEEGLEVESPITGGTDAATAALLAGTAEIAFGSAEHVVANVESGGELRSIAGAIVSLTHSLIVQPEVKRLEDLRGRTLGVSALSAGTSSLFMDILSGVGLEPGDYTVVEAGTVPLRHEKLLGRIIDAGMQTDPHNYMAEDAGLGNLGPVNKWVPEFLFNAINVRTPWAEANRETVDAFLRAMLRASDWMYENREASVDLAERYMQIPRRYVERAWEDTVSSGAVPRDLHVPREGLRVAIEMMQRDRTSQVRFAAEEIDVDRYVDTSYLEAAQRAVGVSVAALV